MEYEVDFNSKIDMNKHQNRLEEAVRSVRAGKGHMAQVVKDDDGNIHFFNVYGPMPDKLDHILNIFIDSESISPLTSALVSRGMTRPVVTAGSDDSYEGIQVTIDYTDKPIMWVLRITKTRLCLNAYQRDENKSFNNPAIENAWDLENGSLAITPEKLNEDTAFFFVMVFNSLRHYLETEGLIDQLRKLNKYAGAGILVSVKDNDQITARIVQGKERPDLPCERFLLGSITCRPYLDEMLEGSDEE